MNKYIYYITIEKETGYVEKAIYRVSKMPKLINPAKNYKQFSSLDDAMEFLNKSLDKNIFKISKIPILLDDEE